MLVAEIEAMQEELTAWQRDMRHPELGFEENHAADFVAQKTELWYSGSSRVGKTGVVGVLRQAMKPVLSAYAPIWMLCRFMSRTTLHTAQPTRAPCMPVVMTDIRYVVGGNEVFEQNFGVK